MTTRFYAPVFFAVFVCFLIFSNNYDWDFFFSTLEVDLRSWFIDGKLPLWSYQLCGGVTRIGDPQSFGISPIFILVWLLGSFWGAKAIWLVSAGVGFWYLRKLLLLLTGEKKPSAATALSLMWVFGNYFLWHSQVGHLTFAMHYWAVVPIYCTLKAIVSRLTRKEFAIGAFALWTILSGGLYHTTVFLLLPFYIAATLVVLALSIAPRLRSNNATPWARTILSIVGFHLIGAVLASYKLYNVAAYQRAMPRTVPQVEGETLNLLDLLFYQFAPTIDSVLETSVFSNRPHWGIWEYSAFSPAPWLLLFSLILAGRRVARFFDDVPKSVCVFIGVYSVIALSFSIGNVPYISLHNLVNKSLLHYSVRAIGRYQIGLSLLFTILASLALVRLCSTRPRLSTHVLNGGLLIALANFITFFPRLEGEKLKEILSYANVAVGEMKETALVLPRTQRTSFMYEQILKGRAVLNCYMPLTRDIAVTSETITMSHEYLTPANSVKVLPFIDEPCLQNSFFTQNDVFISADCPPGTCTNLNGVNLHKLNVFKYDSAQHRFCLPER